jgi:4-carboxymuconolactone decarboxylase
MSNKDEDMKSLNQRERELTAIGAAIASNCVPCIEYHIPQARKVGLSDLQIHEAVRLADKVRRVPADKVLQTALALLDEEIQSEPGTKDVPCGSVDTDVNEGQSPNCGPAGRDVDLDQLDNRNSREDNKMKSQCCSGQTADTENACGSDQTAADGQQGLGDSSAFDLPKMMAMMRECCPGKMKDFSSMMSHLEGGCCASDDKDGRKEPGATKSGG